MHSRKPSTPHEVRKVESVDTGSINWAYDTPLTAPRRGLEVDTRFPLDTELEVLSEIEPAGDFDGTEGAPIHDGTISPLINTRRDTEELDVIDQPGWETLGLGVFLLGSSALLFAVVLAAAAGLIAFL